MKNIYLIILFSIFYSYCNAEITIKVINETNTAWDIDIFEQNTGKGECILNNNGDAHTFNNMPSNFTIKATAQDSNLTRGKALSEKTDNIVLSKDINFPDGKTVTIYIRTYDCSSQTCPSKRPDHEQGKNNICYYLKQDPEMLKM
ncbi:hypothetical protein KJ644_00210 [Candidatus Dependentiae bacterium]|nr:hypothetical protein [Candidatus Dependentiae bacterium]MBU4386882.1 hypothetical protein [Candidatus Dependentiae bacterium]MCG2755969.1 hypothetical protein [Candidatus Dependentiae bacterium]